ncbi:hypothetical protein [Arthrobacter sp. PAMC25564]|uniref:hypothetical protein n=1 Tax=Arthrobacter sp. PAMC25564 TaxID=2565366 RepID=UPI00197C6081|nr:hypothetical protein [Arthrobacter sp. PAMC25564]
MILARILQLAISFLWLGLVAAISFIETPLKFRAPGMTVPLAVGIGRLVFRALNWAELVLARALAVLAAVAAGPPWATAWLAGVVLLTLVQALGSARAWIAGPPARPRRTPIRQVGGAPPPIWCTSGSKA